MQEKSKKELQEEIGILSSEIINLVVLIVLAIIVLNFISDRTFVGTYAETTQKNTKSINYTLSLDNEMESSISYFENCMKDNEITQDEINEQQAKAAKETKDYKKYLKSLSKHKNTVGWISIGGIIVDYPIMYSKYQDYYLEHNVNDEEDIYGAIYLDASSDGEFSTVNVIHGHNMRDGEMFGELDKYKNQKFLNKHLYFNVTTPDGTRQYKIFSVTIVDGDKERIPTGFDSKSDYRAYLKRMNRLSLFPLEYSKDSDNIVILNTCSYEFTNAHFLVLAEQVK
jgi:SrtB family sortase